MMTLTEFLLARIAEDETNGHQLRSYEHLRLDSDVKPEILSFADPARVLAECEAKRRIVVDAGTLSLGPGIGAVWAMKQLAAVYADHPDYRQEWRP